MKIHGELLRQNSLQPMEILNKTPFEIATLPSRGPQGKTVLTVIVKGTFDMRYGEPAEVASEQIPVAFGDEFYDEKNGGGVKFESDVAPFKPRADIVLVGLAYAPGGRPVQILDVLLRVGRIKKIIRVFGDRHWKCPPLLPIYPSDPQFFTVMDIVYERAFGGMDTRGGEYCRENLSGRGFFAKKPKKTLENALLPNLEDPANLIKSWKDHPKPVGFGFYGRAWMPRAGHIGTYDERWREERSPELPEDFRFDYHNGAHPDLQMEGYLKGDEEVELVNLTTDGTISFRLPGIRVNCNITKSLLSVNESKSSDTSLVPEEMKLNLDTLCLIPDEKRFYLVWRGLCPLYDLSALEVKRIKIVAHVCFVAKS